MTSTSTDRRRGSDRGDYGYARVRDQAFDAVLSLWRKRKAQGMLRKEIAETLNTSESWVSKQFRGPSNWTLRTIGELIEAMDGELEITAFGKEEPASDLVNSDAYSGYDDDPPSKRIETKSGSDAVVFSLSVLMPKKIQIGNALLAEYVGQGNRNKHTLVNVYSGDIIVKEIPAELAFGLYIEMLRPALDSVPEEFDLTLNFDSKTVFKATARMSFKDDSKTAVFMIPMFQLPVPNDGQLEVVIVAKGFQKATVISKRIYQDVFA